MPVFYIGLILLTFLAAQLRLFPVGGYGDTFVDRLYHLFLPSVTVALYTSAIIMRNLTQPQSSRFWTPSTFNSPAPKDCPPRLILGTACAARTL